MPLTPIPGNDPTAAKGASSGGILDSVLNVLDPGNARKQISRLFEGGLSSDPKKSSPTSNVTKASGKNSKVNDWRVKVTLPSGSGLKIASNPLLSILARNEVNGVIFPYTPNITVTHNARYQEQALTHANYKNYFYEGSDVSAINIVGDFTVQNKDDALYVLASLYFFRSCTKMFWGKDANAGNPPPIVILDGYGDFYFPSVTCVVTSFQHTMPSDVDYMEVSYSGSSNNTSPVSAGSTMQTARIPLMSQFNVTLQPIYSRKNTANNMSLTNFSQGKLLAKNGGFL